MLANYSDHLQEFMLFSSLAAGAQENWEATLELYELWCAGDEAALIERIAVEESWQIDEEDIDLESLEGEDLEKAQAVLADLDNINAELVKLQEEYNTAISVDRNEGMLEVAKSYLESGDTIFIAGSTTTFFLAEYLRQIPNITVITNSPHMNIRLSEAHVKNLCAGGEMLPNSTVLVGSETERFIRGIRAAKFFFSARGYANGVISDSSKSERDIKITMLEQSQKSYFLYDRSKLDQVYPFCIAKDTDVTELIDET
jgi:DeoR/GlpR family transcriptional regulator of sugar metabolism